MKNALLSALLVSCAVFSVGCEGSPSAKPEPATSPEGASKPDTAEPAAAAKEEDKAALEPKAEEGDTPEPADTADPGDKPGAVAQGDKPKTDPTTTAEPTASAAPEPPKDEKTEEAVKGKAATEATYSVWLQGGGKYKAGQPGTVQAVIIPKEGYKCNAEYPFKFKGAASDGVTFAEEVSRNASISPQRTTVSVPIVPTRAGDATVSGTLSFSVCSAENCVIQKTPIAVKVKVD